MFLLLQNKLVLCLAIAALAGCTNDLKENFGRPSIFTMRPAALSNLPNDDSSYSQGLRDGCNTALRVIGVGPMATSYDDSYYDINRGITDQDYYKGRTTGFNYCTYYQDPDPL
ncbi:MAG TPA: hypothetical protein DIV86_05730 [Alphaproteobacteria bacterium]|nr:hypothetical protein [Alphaproteobacteria bacterium]